MKLRLFLISILILSMSVIHSIAQKQISIEKIWEDHIFWANSVPGFNFQNDGQHYTRLEGGKIKQYDLTTGKETAILFDASADKVNAELSGQIDGYAFSKDEKKLLVKINTEKIYRHSTRADFYVWDFQSEKLTSVFENGKQRYASFSPDGTKIGFVHRNNLYCKDLVTNKITQVTQDGKQNHIINGATDWVYEEEFSMSRAFEWSPDSKKMAFMRFDESEVKEFTLTKYKGESYPEYETFKYPKVGERNAVVSVHIYDINTDKTVAVDKEGSPDTYFPRIKWTKNANQLCVFKMNRHQNELELLLANAVNGKTSLLLKETNKYYIDIHDNLTFLKDEKHFIWTTEQDGYNHIYLYQMNGKLKQQITKGQFDVAHFYGINEDKEILYYQAGETSPLERQVYSIDLNGKNKKKLTPEKGWNSTQFSSTFDYYVNSYSTANTPPSYIVYNNSGKEIRVIETNERAKELQEEYGATPIEFFNFKTSEDVDLNGWMMKPANFDPNKKYPVFMYLYGGPGSQSVTDRWSERNYWWFQMLTQQGYIVSCIDNRGTGGRGEEFKKMTYLELGKYETIDQIEGAKYLGSLPYADAGRIGIFGWSYGGYMSSLCLFKGNDVFKAAIAVAPVTNWKWYDSIYTERYMRTETENPTGYKDNSPINFADRLKGNYLLVHGGGDDNVHFQNTAEITNALIRANKQFDTYYYPNRNHFIYGGKTRSHLYHKMTNFLDENLMNGYKRSTP